MEMYEVDLYYSTYVTLRVEAGSVEAAIENARNEVIEDEGPDLKLLLRNLESWEECDEAREVSKEALLRRR
jgi:hypothetical protein